MGKEVVLHWMEMDEDWSINEVSKNCLDLREFGGGEWS
jgi:hypothetical protein